MVEAAVEGAGDHTGILAVTVLTSFTARDLGVALGREAPETGAEVLRLAGVAAAAGAHGIVCSGHEVHAVRTAYPRLRSYTSVTPLVSRVPADYPACLPENRAIASTSVISVRFLSEFP
jgi:orotidine-5'-phosphate decarboxylase